MNDLPVKAVLLWVSSITGFIAAALWFCATRVSVEPHEQEGQGMKDLQIIEEKDGKRSDFFATLERQGRWNRWAAGFTAVSVGCQAMSNLFH